MSDLHQRVASTLLTNISLTMLSGLSYREGIAMYPCAVLLMEEIDRKPDIDDDWLADQVMRLVEQECGAEK